MFQSFNLRWAFGCNSHLVGTLGKSKKHPVLLKIIGKKTELLLHKTTVFEKIELFIIILLKSEWHYVETRIVYWIFKSSFYR